MELPEREYYTPEELVAEQWKHMSVSLIEHLIDTGKIKPAWYILEDFPNNSEDPTLSDEEIERLHRFGYYKALENYERQYKWFYERPSHDPHAKFTHIMLEEVKRFEEKVTGTAIPNTSALPDYLDSSHEYFSMELNIAIKTWQKLYGVGGCINTKNGHKDQIKEALKSHGLSKEATDRISTLINPQNRKKGGLPAVRKKHTVTPKKPTYP